MTYVAINLESGSTVGPAMQVPKGTKATLSPDGSVIVTEPLEIVDRTARTTGEISRYDVSSGKKLNGASFTGLAGPWTQHRIRCMSPKAEFLVYQSGPDELHLVDAAKDQEHRILTDLVADEAQCVFSAE
jgi:hypothetical protein